MEPVFSGSNYVLKCLSAPDCQGPSSYEAIVAFTFQMQPNRQNPSNKTCRRGERNLALFATVDILGIISLELTFLM